MAKFSIGDRVVITKKAPKLIRDEVRLRNKRTIVDTYYDKKAKRHVYHIGENRRGKADSLVTAYPFRSYYLELAKKHRVGRPKTTRKYKRRKY